MYTFYSFSYKENKLWRKYNLHCKYNFTVIILLFCLHALTLQVRSASLTIYKHIKHLSTNNAKPFLYALEHNVILNNMITIYLHEHVYKYALCVWNKFPLNIHLVQYKYLKYLNGNSTFLRQAFRLHCCPRSTFIPNTVRV